MEYLPLKDIPYYTSCEGLVSGLGYSLISIKVMPQKGRVQVEAVIAFKDPEITDGIGIDDCAKVHRLLAPRMEALLQNQDVYMEVTSPGMERHIKNAAEFQLFKQKNVKVYNTQVTDWVEGKILNADESKLTLEIENSGKTVDVLYSDIAKAKLMYV